MKLIRAKLIPESSETLEELTERILIRLETYKSKHNDYTYKIESHTEDNYLIVINFKEEEEIN